MTDDNHNDNVDSVIGEAELAVHAPFIALSREVRELGLTTIQRLPSPPTPLEFYREYVSANRPVIIENAANHWPAMHRWHSNDYLLSRLGDANVSVAVTPDGAADSIDPISEHFALPCQERWKFADFLSKLTTDSQSKSGPQSGVVYAQQQNSSFTQEFAVLSNDVLPFEWANEAFGCTPEATNLWIGSSLSATSPHLDHYENLYTVIGGEKLFVLWPPCDSHWMNQRWVRQATWQRTDGGGFELALDSESAAIPWPAIDVRREWRLNHNEHSEESKKSAKQHTVDDNASVITPALRRRYAPPLCVRLRAGETLYLPSLWWHGVLQGEDSEGKTIAINQWFDMRFDAKYAYYQFVSQQSQRAYPRLQELRQRREHSGEQR